MAHALDSFIYMHRHKDILNAIEKCSDPDKKAELQEQADKEMIQAIRFHEKSRQVCEGPSRPLNATHKRKMGSEGSVLTHVKVRHFIPLCSPQAAASSAPDSNPRPSPTMTNDKASPVDHTPRRKKKSRPNAREADSIVCERCHASRTMLFDQKNAHKTCTACGHVMQSQCETVGALDMLWRDTSVGKGGSYSYKRANHLYSWILRIQAKESTTIPEEHMELLRAELEKMQLDLDDPSKVTAERIRLILKKLKLHLIRYQLCGHRPPQMTEAQEREVMNMFDDVVEIYTELQKRGIVKRSNMLSYSYTLAKMLELLGTDYDQFLPQLTLLKHRERLREQESIWRSVCEASGEFLEQPFVFHPTTFM